MPESSILWAAIIGLGLFIAVYFAISSRRADEHPILKQYAQYLSGSSPRAGAEQALVVLPRSLGRWLTDQISNRTQNAGKDSQWYAIGQRRRRLSDSLEAANLKLRPEEWIGILIGVGAICFALAFWRFNLVVAVIAGVIVPYAGGDLFLRLRRNRRLNQFMVQLPDLILKLSAALRAGYSFGQALQAAATQSRPPAGDEFSRAVKEIQLGLPPEEAMRRMVDRIGSEDLDLLVSAVNINRVVGGNLGEALENIATTIRERVRIKGEIRVLTAQARISGWIISLLPIGLAVVLSFIAPDYFDPMISDYLGLIMLGTAAFSMLIGALIIRRIVDIDI